jgi:lipase (class 3)
MAILIPTDAELVDAAAGTYEPTATPIFEDVGTAIRVFLTVRDDGINIIAIEGTHSPLGWLLDFAGIKAEDQQGVNHASLGFVHGGFYASAVAILTRCALIAEKNPYAICGHSLGAALALLVGALLIDDGLPPIKTAAFAPPRVGGPNFVRTACSVPFCAYRYGGDPVTEVPMTLPSVPWTQVPLRILPATVPFLDPFHYHAIGNYVTAVHALPQALPPTA